MKKVLVIEDEEAVRQNLLELFELENFTVLVAPNGRIGVEVAQVELPDLILCDVTMPDLDGYGVLTLLRKNPSTAAIPFIFLTAKANKPEMRHGMDLGADDYLTKPFTIDELLQSVNSRLEKQTLTQQHAQQKLEALRNSIIRSLPHELRTPLNGIMGLADYLKSPSGLELEEVQEIAGMISDSAERLFKLVQNFLLYTDLQLMATQPERTQKLRSQSVNLHKTTIVKLIQAHASLADRTDDIKLNLTDVTGRISEHWFEKIVVELIENALKYSDAGTPIQVNCESGEQTLVLSIRNTGRGMTNSQIAQVGACMQFERSLYEQQGAGLGLSLVNMITQLHGGQMTIESIPDQEITVCVILPA